MGNTILEQIFSDLERMQIPLKDAALQAGITSQSLSRIRRRGTTDLEIAARLAAVVGAKLSLAPVSSRAERILNGTFFDRNLK